MGFDSYNWGTVQSTSTWQPFPAIAGQIYSSLATKGKPIMIPETASAELGGDKSPTGCEDGPRWLDMMGTDAI